MCSWSPASIGSPGALATCRTSCALRQSSWGVLEGSRATDHTGSPAGKCFLDMLGVFAEFETNPVASASLAERGQGALHRIQIQDPPNREDQTMIAMSGSDQAQEKKYKPLVVRA